MPYSWHQTINSSVLKGYITKDVDNVSEYVKGINVYFGQFNINNGYF